MPIMSDGEYSGCCAQVVRMAAMARSMPLEEFLTTLVLREAMGPAMAVDPDSTVSTADVRRLAQSLRRFQVDADRVARAMGRAEVGAQ